MNILSVDDSAIIRRIIQGAADVLGYGFMEAGNGQEALDILGAHGDDIALVVLDWNMPVKDGFETLQEIKADSRFCHIPVMMVTTENEKGHIIKAIQCGAKHYLTKPFTHEDLVTKLAECLGQGF